MEGIVGRKNSMTLAEKVALAQMATRWQEREIRFEADKKNLGLLAGEEVLVRVYKAEDVKGGDGKIGSLFVTSLRIMWLARRDLDKKKHDGVLNLSVGMAGIFDMKVSALDTRVGGNLCRFEVLSRFENSKYQFLFHCSATQTTKLEAAVRVWKAFGVSRLYRELKLRGSFVKNGELDVLPGEQMMNRIGGVMNLANNQGNNGQFFLTQARLVWCANHNESFNVSIPFTQILAVKLRDSKFGQALVIETSPKAGGYLLGFSTTPVSRLEQVYTEIRTVWKSALARPNLGTSVVQDLIAEEEDREEALKMLEDVQITDNPESRDVLLSYILDPGSNNNKHPVYCSELGVAIEPLKMDMTLDELWSVL